jgi:hypothetical protein
MSSIVLSSDRQSARKIAVDKFFRKSPKKQPAFLVILKILASIALIPAFVLKHVPVIKRLFRGKLGAHIGFDGIKNRAAKTLNYYKEYKASEPKPTDSQMNAWMDEDKKKISQNALTRLNLHSVSAHVINLDKPLVVIGPMNGARYAKGSDGIIRFSLYQIIVIYVTNHHLCSYCCELDFETGIIAHESTYEYHYADVVSVSTSNANSEFSFQKDGESKPISRYQQFSISVSSGESIKVAVSFPHLADIIGSGDIGPTGSEEAVATIRAMLREKKGGLVAA